MPTEQHPADAMQADGTMSGRDVHAGHDLAGMVRDMRDRFLVAAVLSIPILLWSPTGRDALG